MERWVISPGNLVLGLVLTVTLCLFMLSGTFSSTNSNDVVKLVDVWLSGKFGWVSVFGIPSTGIPGYLKMHS